MSQETTVEQPASPNTSTSSLSSSLQTTTDVSAKPEIKGLEGTLSSSPLSSTDKGASTGASQQSPNGKTPGQAEI